MTKYSDIPKPHLPSKKVAIIPMSSSKFRKVTDDLIKIAKEGEKIRNSYINSKNNDPTVCYL